VHVVQLIDSLNWGGAQKLLQTFAETARPSLKRLTIISLRETHPGVTIPDQLRRAGCEVITLPARHLFNISRIRKLVAYLRQQDVDVLHTHLTYANILGPLAGRLSGVPVVSTVHNEFYDPKRDNRTRRRLETWSLRWLSKRIIAVSHAVAEAQQHRFGAKPMAIIPNCVMPIPSISPDERRQLRAQVAGETTWLLISVGRLARQKGYPDLAEAFSQVHQRYPSSRLIIAGHEGSTQEKLKERIAELNLQDSALLLGPRSDVPALLKASDMFVSASLWEGLPIALLEAMAAGLPVVATSVGDVPRVIEEGCGVLVPPGEPARLAEEVCALLENPGKMKALGEAAEAHVAKHYAPQAWAAQLLELYQAVCAR